MKIAYCSDLHLEFEDLTLKNEENADVLVLAGDICVAKHLHKFQEFFQKVQEEFPKVIYVIGNHEHYGHLFNDTVKVLKENLPDIHILDNETVVIEDITFVGGTLWTDMNEEDPTTMSAAGMMMPDFKIVKYFDGVNYMKYTTAQSIREYNRTSGYINIVTQAKDKNYVVITHHSPSIKSCHEKYAHDTVMNGAFHNNLDDFIAYRPQIKVWIHGHTHDPFDYEISSTRVLCNPRGYPRETSNWSFKLKYIEV